MLTTELWQNQALRSQVVAEATAIVNPDEGAEGVEAEGKAPQLTAEEAEKLLSELGLPIGWQRNNLPKMDEDLAAGQVDWLFIGDWALKGVGWFITGLAISQGSSFWFDFLNKLMKVRDSGPKPEEKKEGGK